MSAQKIGKFDSDVRKPQLNQTIEKELIPTIENEKEVSSVRCKTIDKISGILHSTDLNKEIFSKSINSLISTCKTEDNDVKRHAVKALGNHGHGPNVKETLNETLNLFKKNDNNSYYQLELKKECAIALIKVVFKDCKCNVIKPDIENCKCKQIEPNIISNLETTVKDAFDEIYWLSIREYY